MNVDDLIEWLSEEREAYLVEQGTGGGFETWIRIPVDTLAVRLARKIGDVVALAEAATREEIADQLADANFSLGASLVARGSDDPEATLNRVRARVAEDSRA